MIDNETTTNTEISTVDLNELAELDRKYSDGRDSGSSGAKDGFSLPVLKVSYAQSPDPHPPKTPPAPSRESTAANTLETNKIGDSRERFRLIDQ